MQTDSCMFNPFPDLFSPSPVRQFSVRCALRPPLPKAPFQSPSSFPEGDVRRRGEGSHSLCVRPPFSPLPREASGNRGRGRRQPYSQASIWMVPQGTKLGSSTLFFPAASPLRVWILPSDHRWTKGGGEVACNDGREGWMDGNT